MPASRLVRRRQVLLRALAPLRTSSESDQSVFWAITGLNALWLLVTVICDLVLNWERTMRSPVEIAATVVSALLAIGWILTTVMMKERFPRWAGALGYFTVTAVIVTNLAVGQTPVFASTSLHILPVIAMYVGWFWPPKTAVPMFSTSVILIIGGVWVSPVVGTSASLTPSIAVYTISIMVMAFALASYLRTNMKMAAHTDALTRALNNRGMQLKMRVEFLRARRQGEPLSVVLVDLDGFKQLNDTYGHPHGDTVLAESAQHWSGALRSYDLIGRVGGDEFMFVFPRTTEEQALQVLNRLQMNSVHPWTWGLSELRDDDSVESLLERADARLYAKKMQRPRGADGRALSTHTPCGSRRSPERHRSRGPTLPRQTSFTVMSSTLGFFVLLPIAFGTLLNPPDASRGVGWLAFSAFVLAAILIAMPLMFGSRYPARACFWTSAVVLTYLVVFAWLVQSTSHGMALLYATSFVALYLGTFSGTHASRILLISGLLLLSIPLLYTTHLSGNESDQHLVTTAVIYGAIVYCILFELSSYLYSRSRAFVEHDALTGALNRNGLAAHGMNELARAERGGYPLAAVMLDCVSFKKVNDAGGHSAGNRVLRAVTDHFASRLGPEDIFVRLGGDEFFILLPYHSADVAEAKIRHILRTAPIGMHLGVTEYQAGDTIDGMIARADDTLIGPER